MMNVSCEKFICILCSTISLKMCKADVLSKKMNELTEEYPQIMRETMMRQQKVKKMKNECCTACSGIGKK